MNSLQEAIDWAGGRPEPVPRDGIRDRSTRQVFEAEDFGEVYTPELRAQEERQRAEMAKR